MAALAAPAARPYPRQVMAHVRLWREWKAKQEKDKAQDREIKRLKKSMAVEQRIALGNFPTVQGFSDAPYVTMANQIAQGDAFNQREGDTLKPRSQVIRWSINPGAASVRAQYLRIVVLRDKQPTGALPNVGTIFQQVSVAQNDGITLNSPLQFTTHKIRFACLYDRVYDLNKYLVNTGRSECHHGRIVIRNKQPIKYTQADTTGVIANIQKNPIYIVFFFDDVAANAATLPSLTLTSTLRFDP